MSGVLVRLTVFFPVVILVVFVWYVLLLGIAVWVTVILVAVVGLVGSLGANAVLGVLLPWHIRCCARAAARRAEMYQQW